MEQAPSSLWLSKNVLVIPGSVQFHFSLEILHSPNAGAKRTTERIVQDWEKGSRNGYQYISVPTYTTFTQLLPKLTAQNLLSLM